MAALTDPMSLVQFEEELRRIARFDVKEPLADPLGVAVRTIEDNPAFAQSRLLARLLRALTNHSGEFRRAEAAVFDTPTLRIVIALMNAAAVGTVVHDDWVAAVMAADAAGA